MLAAIATDKIRWKKCIEHYDKIIKNNRLELEISGRSKEKWEKGYFLAPKTVILPGRTINRPKELKIVLHEMRHWEQYNMKHPSFIGKIGKYDYYTYFAEWLDNGYGDKENARTALNHVRILEWDADMEIIRMNIQFNLGFNSDKLYREALNYNFTWLWRFEMEGLKKYHANWDSKILEIPDEMLDKYINRKLPEKLPAEIKRWILKKYRVTD